VSNLYHIILLYPVEHCAPLVPLPFAPTCIDWHPLHCLSLHTYVYAHAPFIHFGGCRSRTRRSLSSAGPPASRPGRSFVSSAESPSIQQHAHSHSAFGHIAVSLLLGSSVTPLSVLSHQSSCLTPQHTHPFTCNPYIVTIIDLQSKSAPPSLRSAHH